MEFTPNYNLKKPSYEEFGDVQDINENVDKIDAALKALSDAIAGGASEQEIEELRTVLAAHLADDAKHITAEERTKWNEKQDALPAENRRTIHIQSDPPSNPADGDIWIEV